MVREFNLLSSLFKPWNFHYDPFWNLFFITLMTFPNTFLILQWDGPVLPTFFRTMCIQPANLFQSLKQLPVLYNTAPTEPQLLKSFAHFNQPAHLLPSSPFEAYILIFLNIFEWSQLKKSMDLFYYTGQKFWRMVNTTCVRSLPPLGCSNPTQLPLT